jgi:MFS family permease
MTVSAATPQADLLTPARGWYVVCVFWLCAIISYIDRTVVSILVDALKHSFSIDDAQIGLVQGFAFTVCYAVMGIPLARALDKGNRVKIAGVCVLVWSLATIACGLAPNFHAFMAARAVTAVAEAGLIPAALSIFTDSFSPRRLVGRTSVFMTAPFVGGGLSLVLGGLLLRGFTQSGGLSLPLVGALEPWQSVLVCVGAPGLLLGAVLLATVREPVRQQPSAVSTTNAALPGAVKDRIGFFAPYLIGGMLVTVGFYSQSAWAPSFFIRVHHLGAADVGRILGPINIFFGLGGALLGGVLASRAPDELAARRIVQIAMGVTLAVVPLIAGTYLVASTTLAMVLYASTALLFAMYLALSAIPIQVLAPRAFRAQVIAVAAFLNTVGGGGSGPFFTGWVSERIGGPSMIGHGLLIVAIPSALLAGATLWMALRWLKANEDGFSRAGRGDMAAGPSHPEGRQPARA